jgi:hypothetical protein
MQRDGVTDVDQAWKGYQHGKAPTADDLEIARSILSGKTPDPTGGATHFYTPDAMPKEGEKVRKFDTSGGLESVAGVTDESGHAVRNYRPDWPAQAEFHIRAVSGVPEHRFRFFWEEGNGPVQ